MYLWIEFIIKIHTNLKQVQLNGMFNEELRSIVNSIRKFLKEQEGKVEINQGALGMKYVFRGFIVKN